MFYSSLRVGLLFTVCFMATAVSFQNCEFTGDYSQKSFEKNNLSSNLNGVPYTGLEPNDGAYYAFGVCAGSSTQGVVAQVEILSGSSEGRLFDNCSNSSQTVNLEEFFFRNYSENFFSYNSSIFEYIESFDPDKKYDGAQFVCWLGPGNGGTETSGINIVLKDNSQFVDYIITGEFSDSGERKLGTLKVDGLDPVESGPESGWIFVYGPKYDFIITDTLNERELYTATFKGVIESKEILFEFDCQKQL